MSITSQGNAANRSEISTKTKWLMVTFALAIVCAALMLWMVLIAKDCPIYAYGDYVAWASMAFGVAYLVLLAQLAARLGKSGLVWVAFSAATFPIGFIGAFLVMLHNIRRFEPATVIESQAPAGLIPSIDHSMFPPIQSKKVLIVIFLAVVVLVNIVARVLA